jgi:serine/threonine-protein kinase
LNRNVLLIALRIFVLAIVAGCCGLLFSRLAISLRQLRLVELTVMLAIGTQLVIVESVLMARAAGTKDTASMVSAGILNHFAWSMVILIYGIFMPNTWRRAAAILVPVACIPYAVTFIIDLRYTQVAFVLEMHLVMSLPMTLFAAGVAIYAAHIINSARQDAFEARQYGQYRLQDKLGSGGMGEVYKAEHLLLKRPCAIKLIRPEYIAEPRVLARFEREVKATAKLTHWNTIEIYDYGQAADGTFYYVMELLDGLNLDEIVDRYGPLPPERAVHFLSQTCNALREAHATGLVHRDIKPANIFAARLGGVYDVAKLLDFGVVRETTMPDDPNLTGLGTIVGTSLYMSPEQALASGYATRAADIYSLGGVAYFLLTGRPPFVGTSITQVLVAHARENVTPPSEFRPDLPKDLEQIVIRCLEKKPRDRFQTAEDLGQALADCACAAQWTQQQAVEWWQQHEEANDQSDAT